MQPQIEDGKVFVSESSVGRLYVYFEEHNGNNFLHIRYWFCDKRDGEIYKPGKKGIAIPEAKVRLVLEALKLLLGPGCIKCVSRFCKCPREAFPELVEPAADPASIYG